MSDHVITIGGLLSAIGIIAGLLLAGFGVLSAFANGMADTQGDGGKQGCTFFVVGALIVAGCLWALLA